MDITKVAEADIRAAEDTIASIHKRAYLGRLAQHGHRLQGSPVVVEKEASALLDLGFSLANLPAEQPSESPAVLGNGRYAQAKYAFDHLTGNTDAAPGFAKVAQQAANTDDGLPELPQGLLDAAYRTAYQLACDPHVFKAAQVRRAQINQILEESLASQAG